MQLPDYDGNNIVNMMSSIITRFNGTTPYLAHSKISRNMMADAKNVILIVIDGLGFNFFTRHFKKSALAGYLAGSTTSVFPATTAAAISSSRPRIFTTPLPSAQHQSRIRPCMPNTRRQCPGSRLAAITHRTSRAR